MKEQLNRIERKLDYLIAINPPELKPEAFLGYSYRDIKEGRGPQRFIPPEPLKKEGI